MLVTLDIGNSHVRFGGFCGDDMRFVASIATDDRLTGEQYACQLRDVFGLYGIDPAQIDGVVFCSVVPSVTPAIHKAIRMLTGCEPLGVGSGVKTGLNLKIDQPRALGSDLVANAVWAAHRGKLPCVVVDMGTATTFTVLDRSGVLIGTAIAAGVKASLDTLKNMAAQLPAIRMEAPARGVLGHNTVDAMKSGAVYGAAAMVDGMVRRIADALGETPYVLLCGGTGEAIAPYLATPAECDPSVACPSSGGKTRNGNCKIIMRRTPRGDGSRR